MRQNKMAQGPRTLRHQFFSLYFQDSKVKGAKWTNFKTYIVPKMSDLPSKPQQKGLDKISWCCAESGYGDHCARRAFPIEIAAAILIPEFPMSTTIKRIVLTLAAFILVVFAVFLFNQTTQIVQSARSLNPVFGNAVMWGLIFLYAALLVTPFVLWFRLPKRMLPPATMEGEAYDSFLAEFKRRLARNPRLRGICMDSDDELNAALQILDKHADDVVTEAASAVFLSTAVLQSGRLDVLVVFAAQTRLIWKIAHVYYQRPSLRDFVQLYANVASTAFIAAGIEDIDVDVLVSTVFGSTVAAIPGMHLLTSSVLSGSANAFLTLRVGMITKEYCRCTTQVEKKGLRRAATLRAAKLLGSIVSDGTRKLSRATLDASKTKLRDAFTRLVTKRPGTAESA
jgi:Domain of unknown function (DUF697)